MIAPQAEHQTGKQIAKQTGIQAGTETTDGRTAVVGVADGRWGMRLSVWWGIGIAVFVVGCDSNPTPHPQGPGGRNEDTVGVENVPDRDDDFAAGDAGDAVDAGDEGPPWSHAEGDACGEVAGDAGPHLDDGRDNGREVVEGDAGDDACPESDDQGESGAGAGVDGGAGAGEDEGDGTDSGGRASSANEPSYSGPPRPIGADGR